MKQLDVESLCSELDWKQFEALTRHAFESFGYTVASNYRLKRPRIEVDLLALRHGRGFAVDCKHWKRTAGRGNMLGVAQKQIERAKRLMLQDELEEVVPLIVTWREETVRILENGVPIVPISKLADFILNFGTTERMIVIIRA